MSYILQALKDSQEERSRIKSSAPADTVEPVATQTSARSRLKPRILVLGVLLLTLVAGWYVFKDRLAGSSEPAIASGPAQEARASLTDTALVSTQTAEPDMRGVKLIIDTPQTQQRAVGVTAQKRSADSSISAKATQVENGKKAASLGSTESPADVAETKPEDPYANLPYLRQLPVSTQRELPGLKISVHIYSDNRASRMVKLNGRMMREGQRVASNLNIEAIIPRAVVFNYSGTSFKVPAR